jgi:probable rRNA maturation factor
VAVDVSLGGVRAGVSRADLAGVVEFVLRSEGVRHALVSVALLSPHAIARLNRAHLGHAGSTDVLSFSLTAAGRAPIPVVADIYLCPAVARANARALGASPRTEMLRIAVHGALHATGWDHPSGARRVRSRMWARQEKLLAAWIRRAAVRAHRRAAA